MVEELVANAFDDNVTRVDVAFEHLGRQDYRLTVTDDNPAASNVATCGPHGDNAIDMALNVGTLRPEWFSDQPATCERNIDLLIHELGPPCRRDGLHPRTRK